MKQSILKSEIELKDKQQQKVIDAVNQITPEYLTNFLEIYNKLKAKRQGIEEPIRVQDVNNRKHLVDIGEQVAMRQFDAFGHAF